VKRDAPPPPTVRLEGGRLTPVTASDAELMAAYAHGTEFDLKHRSRRSNPHNGMYWAILSRIVKATDAYPTPEHMHRWVKMRLGYTDPICDPSGRIIAVTVDSTAFAAMDQAAFNVFFEKAMQLIAAEMGIDASCLI